MGSVWEHIVNNKNDCSKHVVRYAYGPVIALILPLVGIQD